MASACAADARARAAQPAWPSWRCARPGARWAGAARRCGRRASSSRPCRAACRRCSRHAPCRAGGPNPIPCHNGADAHIRAHGDTHVCYKDARSSWLAASGHGLVGKPSGVRRGGSAWGAASSQNCACPCRRRWCCRRIAGAYRSHLCSCHAHGRLQGLSVAGIPINSSSRGLVVCVVAACMLERPAD